MAAETMVRPRRVLRAGYPFLTIVFLAILAAGIDGGMVAAVVLGAAGACATGLWSVAAWRGRFVVGSDGVRLRTLRGWHPGVRFDELSSASWSRTPAGTSLVLLERTGRSVVVPGLDYSARAVRDAVGPRLGPHADRSDFAA